MLNSLFTEMNRPLQPLWVAGALLYMGNDPGTSPERSTPYRWTSVEAFLFSSLTQEHART